MGLSGGLSNHPVQDLLQCLTGDFYGQGRTPRAEPSAGWPDGRRAFGTVGDSIVSVLARAGSEMRIRAIHEEVETVLEGSVSFQSVADYLRRRSSGRRPLFVRTRYGHYQLRAAAKEGR